MMQSVWLEDGQVSVRNTTPLPSPPISEALVRVRLAGICATDLELIKGYYPYQGILGHEFVGEIAAAPAAPERIGQRVVGEINAYCGYCEHCLAKRPTHCSHRTVLGIVNRDGAFAEYLRLPLANLISVPECVTDEQAVFTEPLAAALEIQEQTSILPGSRVLVIGAGRLGQLIAQTLFLTGCELRVVVRHAKQRRLLEQLGILAMGEADISARTMDIVVEATGSEAGLQLACRAIRPRGTIVLKSTYQGMASFDFSTLVVDEITLIGSRCGSFLPALQLLANRQIDPLPLIEARYPLYQALQALAEASRPGTLKVLLECSDI